MNNEEIMARKLFKEQIRKELLEEIGKYQIGVVFNGEMLVKKTSDIENGHIFIIPDDQYQELFS